MMFIWLIRWVNADGTSSFEEGTHYTLHLSVLHQRDKNTKDGG